MDQDTGELTVILETQDEALIAVAKALLEGSNIEFTTSNELSREIWPGDAMGGIQILVRPEDADDARAILADLEVQGIYPWEAGLSDAQGPGEMEETAADDQPAAPDYSTYAAPKPEQPFSIRLLIVAAIFLIPIILAIIYSLQK